MIKKTLLVLLVATCMAFIPEPEKEYGAKASIAEWQVLLAHPDDVPKNQRDKVVAKFVAQLQSQISADTIQPKKK